MAICDMCGNDYDKTFTVTRGDRQGTYDSFECAITAWAPGCAHCGCRILGHGIESEHGFFCCSHCARAALGAQRSDRVNESTGR
ncbi:hypothetical protein [Intrasporangium sp.]|uniref:hypothetical protein n=1 Tax=Intrasporangium sp. TaxID=1925024 RepID=UPI00293A92C3|nr:hypothetical protein [Intrasporangium sp.]MDV3220281.1 hypothetical protein [Intrasporangium sp.]